MHSPLSSLMLLCGPDVVEQLDIDVTLAFLPFGPKQEESPLIYATKTHNLSWPQCVQMSDVLSAYILLKMHWSIGQRSELSNFPWLEYWNMWLFFLFINELPLFSMYSCINYFNTSVFRHAFFHRFNVFFSFPHLCSVQNHHISLSFVCYRPYEVGGEIVLNLIEKQTSLSAGKTWSVHLFFFFIMLWRKKCYLISAPIY